MRTYRTSAKRPWGLADWFGLAVLILLVACSAMLYVRLVATDMVTENILDTLLYGLIAVNVVFLPFLLIRWRRAGVKIAFSVLALIAAAGMIYGITAADTLQPEAANMAPAYLKETFGDRMCFHGCISTAGPLAFGTPEQVRENVRETLEDVFLRATEEA